MKLYFSPGACSMSPHIVATEAGIPLDLIKVDLKAHKTESGEDYYAINPKGSVPALRLDDGSLLTEGPAIVQYLADQKPETKLAPANGTIERYRLMEWLTYINGEIHKTFSPLFGASSDDVKADARAKLGKKFEYVNTQLEGKQFLMGDTFTVADAYLFVMTTWAKAMKLDLPVNVAAFAERIAKRPAVAEVQRVEAKARAAA